MWAIYSPSIARQEVWKWNTHNFRISMWRSVEIKTDKNNHLLVSFLVSTFRKPNPPSANIYQEILLLIMRNNRDG